MKRSVLLLLSAVVSLTALIGTSYSQTQVDMGQIEQDLALLRGDLRSERKQLIALNVPLSDAEAKKFWPLYDQYSVELAKHNDELWALLKDYAAKRQTLSDADAAAMMKRWGDIQLKREQTRQKYIPLVGKAIPGRKAALFFQIDRRIWMLLDLQVASEVPLVTQAQ